MKSVKPVAPRGEHRWEHLDGDVAIEPRVVRAEDLTHPTGAETSREQVWAKAGARVEGRLRLPRGTGHHDRRLSALVIVVRRQDGVDLEAQMWVAVARL